MQIDADKPTPKYLQVRDILIQHLTEQHYQPDQQIPTENELIAQFNVSRITIRQALAELANEGFIYKKHGSGSFFSGKTEHTQQLHHLIGVLTPRITYYIYPYIIEGIDDVVRPRGYNIVLGNAAADPAKEVACLRQLLEKPIDGLLFEPTGGYEYEDVGEAEIFQLVKELSVPVVLMDWAIDDLGVSYVSPDDFAGGLQATSHLAESGHQRIAYIYPNDKSPSQRRYAGHKQALETHGIEHDPRLDKPTPGVQWDEPGRIETLVQELLDLGDQRPTAMCFFNDDAALRAYPILRKAGLTIPDDMSIMGYDDAEFGARVEVPLTTVMHPKYQIGKWAAEILFDEIAHDGQQSPHQMIIKPRLVVRDSVTSR
jgi:GntR family transcriptional regulator, arabinose operon transcriptional repressor